MTESAGIWGWVKKNPIVVISLAAFFLVLGFVIQNREPVTIDFLFWTLVDIPKLNLILISMILGVIVWELAWKVYHLYRGDKK